MDDWREVTGRPFYTQSFECRLGIAFSRKHSKCIIELLGKSTSRDDLEAVCAIDILERIGTSNAETQSQMKNSNLKISESVSEALETSARTVASVLAEPQPSFGTLGEYFAWAFNDDRME